jgi:hypothetical protein
VSAIADNTTLDPGAGGDVIATDDVAGVKYQRVKLVDGTLDSTAAIPGDAANGLDVDVTRSALPSGASTAAKQPALGTAGVASADVITVQGIASGTVVPVSGTVTATGPLTDAQLRATPVPVSGTVTASGPLTDTQLRASAVPVDTELPAAAALADAASNPTAPAVGAFALLWNGATWDRAPGGATNGLTANLKALNGTTIDTNSGAKSAGTQRVILASDQTVVPISDNSGSLTVDAPVATPAFVRLSDGAAAITALPVTDNAGSLTVDNGGTFAVQIAANSSVNVAQVAGTTTAVNAGTNSAGVQRVTLATDQTTLTNTIGNVGVVPVTTGGLTTFHLVSGASTNATNVKASAGQVYGWFIYNSNAAARKVAFHNSAGTPTAGASIFFAIVIPPTSAANVEYTTGIAFGTGIAITTVTDLTDAGATAVAASDLIINLFYK